MDGIFLVDKQKGVSSHDVVRGMRKKLQIKAVGHTGTLDPIASGLLIVCTGFYTKLAGYFVKKDKRYRATAALFTSSPSYDADTEMTHLEHFPVSHQKLAELLPAFSGAIDQTPPSYSALKIDGQKAYDIARKQQSPLSLPKRRVHIHDIQLASFDGTNFCLDVHCSSGTYIRSLVHDIGVALGTDAIMTDLIRTQIADIPLSSAKKLEDIDRADSIHPKHFPDFFTCIDVPKDAFAKIQYGNPWKPEFCMPPQSDEIPILLYYNDAILALAWYKEDGLLYPFRVNAKLQSVV